MSIRDGLTFAAAGNFRPVGGFSDDVISLMRDVSNRGTATKGPATTIVAKRNRKRLGFSLAKD